MTKTNELNANQTSSNTLQNRVTGWGNSNGNRYVIVMFEVPGSLVTYFEKAAKETAGVVDVSIEAVPDLTAQRERVARCLAYDIEDTQAQLNAFGQRFSVNAMDAFFVWADDAVKAAAKHAVATRLLAVFESKGLEVTLAFALEQALSGACHPEHSTSAMSNLTKTEVTAAYADFANRFAVKQ